MQTEQLEHLTGSQKLIASLLAYECLRKHNAPELSPDSLQTAIHACQLVNLEPAMIADIFQGNLSGLDNLHVTGKIFDTEYRFKLTTDSNAWFAPDVHPKGDAPVLMDLDGMRNEFTLATFKSKWTCQNGDKPGRNSEWSYLTPLIT